VEVDGLLEQFVGDSGYLLGPHRPVFLEKVGIPWEIPELEVDVDAGVNT
jgi:hypothetical protein